MPAYFYRIADHLVSAGADEFDNPLGPPRTAVYVSRLEVLKKTPKGTWIGHCPGCRRFVLDAARKKFACPTLEQAKESFRARKIRQLGILRMRIENVERALGTVDEMVERWKKGFEKEMGAEMELKDQPAMTEVVR